MEMLRAWRRKLQSHFDASSRFKKNFLRVASASVFAQALPILASPIMTRLYSPHDFGVLALFVALLGVSVAMATMRFDWLLAAAHTRKAAAHIVVLGVLFVVLACLAFVGICFFGLYHEVAFVDWHTLDRFIWLMPVAVLGSGLQTLLSGWFIRAAHLTPVARARIRQSLAVVALGLIGGVHALGALGLIAATVLGTFIGVGGLFRSARNDLALGLAHIRTLSLFAKARSIRRRMLVSGATGIINVSGLLLPAIMISHYFSAVELGWYALMQRLATGPVGTVTGAVGQSFWGEARSLSHTDTRALQTLFERTSSRLALLSIPVAAACLAGPWYVGPIFGREEWQGAGKVLAALTPFVVAQIIAAPLSSVITIKRHEKWLFFWDLTRTLFVIAVFSVGGYYGIGLTTAVLWYAIGMAVMYALLFCKTRRIICA
ncbi:polysaccharide biosynthesis protein [Methylocaldum marinum]|uniref:Polysaccharide biosynthesis protein n=2 Tax=Methylocaldum marinum TaxID=1432792 RepID=A0A286P4I2_9GAMM|nr:polysaccharide biosynthesis protein [Methylocaldum marinum]